MLAARELVLASALLSLSLAPGLARAEDNSEAMAGAVAKATDSPGTPTDPAHLAAARELARTQFTDDTLEELYGQAASAAAMSFENSIQPALGRALTEGEKQRLLRFWHGQMVAIMPRSALEDLLVPLIARNLSLADLDEINRFNASAAGQRLTKVLPLLMREGQTAGERFATTMADEKWQAQMLEGLKSEFPQWFPAEGAQE